MKLNDIKPNIETSGQFEEQFFSIQDQGMIFDILRNKMYSNPILAICREITSNARDAHREVKNDQPCQVTLPNALEPFYKVKDWGPGISPDRMSNIFIKYTASTKRNDNIQTGGFGLGAKTPFSYSDTFTIETVFDGTKYNYACVIDETKVGKLMPLSAEITDAQNSTEIIIPVKSQDYKLFREGTEFVTRHWETKPIIKGDKFNYQELNFSLEGEGWSITKYDSQSYYNKRDIKLVIDGIEYPVDINQLKLYANTKLLDAINGTIYLYFKVGELSLSASREAVHLDKDTQNKINQKLNIISKDLTSKVLNHLDSFDNLWDATMYVLTDINKTFANVAFLGPLLWQGITINATSYKSYEGTVFEFYKGKKNGLPKTSRSIHRDIVFKDMTVLYINDLDIKDVTVKHVSQGFDNDTSLMTMQVLSLPDNCTWDDMNKKYHLDKLNAKKLSEITKAPRKKKSSSERLLIFKYDTASQKFMQSSYDTFENDDNIKIFCNLERDKYNGLRYAKITTSKGMRNLLNSKILNVISTWNDKNNISIYGIDETISQSRIDESFPDLRTINDFIDKEILANTAMDFIELKYLSKQQYTLTNDAYLSIKDIGALILDKNSLYLEQLEIQKRFRENLEKNSGSLDIYEVINGYITDVAIADWLKKNPDKDVKALRDKMLKIYPLLSHIDPYYHHKLLNPLAHYINLIDTENTNKIKKSS